MGCLEQFFLNNVGVKRVVVFLFLITTGMSYGQDYTAGAIGGFNISNVIGADVNGNGNRIGLHVGAYGTMSVDENWGVRAEFLIFSQKGTSSGKFHTSYLEIPAMATYSFNAQLTVMAGPQFSFLYKATVKDGSGRGTITSDIRKIDIGFLVGGWYQFSEQWGAGLRFVPGLSRVGASGDERTFNGVAQLSVGYRFF